MSSYLDLIRQRVGHEKIILVFASACIRDDAGRLLWQRRSDFGWWGLPGGLLELDESLPDCIIREVKEETGLEVEPMRVIGIYSSPFIQDGKGGLLLKKPGIRQAWTLPFFRMELGERIDQTLVRGILKETGLNVQAKKLIGIYSDHWGTGQIGEIETNRFLYILFQCHVLEEHVKIERIHPDQFRFLSPDSLHPISSSHCQFLHDGLANREETVFFEHEFTSSQSL